MQKEVVSVQYREKGGAVGEATVGENGLWFRSNAADGLKRPDDIRTGKEER